jgi:group I intron endonuclease
VVEGTATEDRLPAPFKSGGREAEHPLTPTIYCLTNQVNGKQYVGLDSYWPGRRNYHLSLLRRGKHYNPKLQRAFDKYCEEAFQFRVLEQLATVEELGPREQHWIRVLGTYPDGYNLTLGGEGTESHLTRNERRKALALLKPKVEKVDGRKLAPAEERVVKQTQSESCDAEGNPHCVECGLSFTDRKELIQHFWFKHRVNAQVTVLHFYHGGVPPLCECGCGEKTRYSPHNSTYNPFTNGHNVKGTQRSDEMRKKLSDARKKMKIEGFYEQFTGENNSNAKAARLKKGR